MTDDLFARGPNFVFAKEYLEQTLGKDGWKSLLDRLAPEHRKIWQGMLPITECYSFGAFKALVKAWTESSGIKNRAGTALLYEHIADRSLNTVYKLFFRLTQPAFVIKNYPRLWARFFTAGAVEVTAAQRGHAMVQFTLPEIFQDWLEPACYGYSKKAVAMGGGRNMKMEQLKNERLPDGTWETVYDLAWEE